MAKLAKGGKVDVIEIVVDGIKYTQTRPGYYFKRTEDGQKRILKSEWELAFEKYTAVDEDDEKIDLDDDSQTQYLDLEADDATWKSDDNWDAEQEVEDRKKAEEDKDRETEDNFNGKKATKKTRRSKDIAHESNGITLTAKQVDFIKHIPDTSFYENGLDSWPWCDVLADEIGGQFARKPMTVGAMISTLREKGLIFVGVDKVNGRKAKFFGFTDLGKRVAKELGLN